MLASENAPYSDSGSEDEWAAPPGALAGPATSAEEEPSRLSGTAKSSNAEMDAVERDLAGASVPVVFQLPSGEAAAAQFFMGQNIEHLKLYLEKEHGLPYSSTTLYLDDRLLLDPLSLSDLPFVSNAENHVKVVVQE